MITLNCDTNVQSVIDMLGLMRHRQMPFAAALALNWTARESKARIQEEMPRVFDRPTRWTMNSLRTEPATKHTLTASVWFRRGRNEYMPPEVEGGPRKAKRSEHMMRNSGVLGGANFWVPGSGANLNAYGNVSSGELIKALSQAQAMWDRTQNETEISRGRRDRRAARLGEAPTRYFVMKRGGEPTGIWMRKGGQLESILAFVSQPRYQRRLPMAALVNEVVRRRFNANFQRAFAQAMATARR